jgi:hypothetical protein
VNKEKLSFDQEHAFNHLFCDTDESETVKKGTASGPAQVEGPEVEYSYTEPPKKLHQSPEKSIGQHNSFSL